MYMMIMSRERVKGVIIGLLVLALLLEASTAKRHRNQNCHITSSCGNIANISYPFRLQSDPPKCGRHEFELICDHNINRTTLSLFETKYYVEDISYENYTIRLVDADLDVNNYCSIPRHDSLLRTDLPQYFQFHDSSDISFILCPLHVRSFNGSVNFSTCKNASSASQTSFFYAAVGISPFDIPDSCNISQVYPWGSELSNLSISDVHKKLLLGFQLDWGCCGDCYDTKLTIRDWIDKIFNGATFREIRYDLKTGYYDEVYHILGHDAYFKTVEVLITGRTSMGLLCLMVLLVYKYQQRHLSVDDSIENFLRSHNNFMPIRYSFSKIKAMTKGFKDKLGQGGYGTVFKAKLQSGNLVAIKLLAQSSKANGQDFINEVATIGRIHHVNVVQLVGFCAEGSKRALVYDYMPNGSLDKFIFSKGENKIPLGWEKMYEIALGVARGIEYLHQGCDMQILHFDIKPHNILLDENFVPKVSDFGLAKLYSTDNSIVSLTAARGTLGYIAPELFYKRIGGVSYKADVYSFGMLLMEMVGRRKKIAFAEQSSEIYFPSWIYDRIYQGEDMELENSTEELKKLVRKMTLVALWCIQMKPVDRPSMTGVLNMLEGEVELLHMPPKPSFHPPDNPIEEHSASSSYIDISSTSY